MDEADDIEPWARRSHRRRNQMPLWQELPLLLIVAFCVAVLIRTFLVQAFFIPSGSMEDTLLKGDRVLVNKVVYDVRDPMRGEVVVFRGTDLWAPELTVEPDPRFIAKLGRTLVDLVGMSRPGEKDYIKRVIGLPGDRIQCCDKGRVTVNGIPLNETYVVRDSPNIPPTPGACRSRQFKEIIVPPGQLFVMGDHRAVSQDARCQGTVPIDNVIGRAFLIIWPQARWTSLSVPATFDDSPKWIAAPDRTGRQPANPDGPTGAALALPILGSFLFAARTRQSPAARHRRLLP